MIEFENVSHVFASRTRGRGRQGSVPVLSDVSFRVRKGEFLSIVGPSGCGKSTILNILVGDVRPTSGTASVDGLPIGSETMRRIGYMFSRDALLPWRTARDNVRLTLELRRRAERDESAVDRLLDLAGLTGFGDHYPWQLSHGMRQRVALCRTLAKDPDILLMDEPFSGLDAQTRTLLGQQVLEICRRAGKTIIFVTHDLLEAIGVGDRIIVCSSRPARILNCYDNPLPQPRNLTELRLDQVSDLYHALWHDLRPQLSDAVDDTRERDGART